MGDFRSIPQPWTHATTEASPSVWDGLVLKCFLNDLGHSLTQSRRKCAILFRDSRVPRPWEFSSGSSSFAFLQKSVLGLRKVLSSQIEGPQKIHWLVHLYRSTRPCDNSSGQQFHFSYSHFFFVQKDRS